MLPLGLNTFILNEAMMKNIILSVFTLLISTSLYATTAVLCGDAEKVDADNSLASVHLIFDQEESRTPDELRTIFYGVETKVSSATEKQGQIFIQTSRPKKTIILNKESIEYTSCNPELNFSLKILQNGVSSIIKNCRCFAD